MKVKIKDQIYDSEKEPIMLILSDGDKKCIENMDPDCSKFCSFPEGHNDNEIWKFMETVAVVKS